MSHGYVPVQWNRNKVVYDRLIAVGVVLFIAIDAGFILFWGRAGRQPDEMTAIIRALGDTAFVMLNIILACGPLSRLDRRFLVALYNRRHLGVTLFFVALAHGVLSLIWYHGFGAVDPITSVFSGQGTYETLADYPFQPLGFLALVILFLLAATSHDYWNANLGASVWKALHMGVYVAYALMIMHIALGPLQSPYSGFPDWLVFASLVWACGLHLAAAIKTKLEDLSFMRPQTNGRVDVGTPDGIEPGRARIVTIDGERIALFKTEEGEIGAIGNACAHQNGPLGEGCIIDGYITCPWHGFQYRLSDGCSPPPFTEKVPTYSLALENGTLFLDPKPLPPGTERPLVKVPNIGAG